jgi:outer membrane protein assembly factor BamB
MVLVIARTVDGRLQALSAADGSVRWTVEEIVPRLSLRGTAMPILTGEAVVAGFDNGKLVAVDVNTGDTLWNVTIDSPTGRTELDRLADIDAPAAASGKDVFVAGFQGRVAMLDMDNGQIWWAKDASSYRGFGLDERVMYLTNANGLVTALRRTDGNQQWEQAALRQRGLTAPAVVGESLVVGDYEGYLHWLSKVDGSVQARAKTDGERITNAPQVAEGRVYVQTDGGKLIAFETRPKG